MHAKDKGRNFQLWHKNKRWNLSNIQYEYKIKSKNSHHSKFMYMEPIYLQLLTGAILYDV